MMPLTRFAPSLTFAAVLLATAADGQRPVDAYLTTGDGVHLLEKQAPLRWQKISAGDPVSIVLDDSKSYQTMDGFGHALTGGSAQLLMKMTPSARTALLTELFGRGPNQTGMSYLRVTIGASDMNDHVYTYDDLPDGQVDPELAHFSVAEDEKDVIPVLREILAISPHLQILASPWTAPAWMKTNDKVKGGTLKPEFADAYAAYFVKYLQAMRQAGIRIAAVTPQNEPENPKNTPSLVFTAWEEADFVGKHLGPALRRAGLQTLIIAFDHNCDHPVYPETVLRDADAAKYTDGSGFHLYRGEMHALTEVHDAFPGKNIYFTEQMVVPGRNDAFPIAQSVSRLLIAAPRNWSRNVLLWNLAADPQNGPHTSDGGCPSCTGALTLDGDHVKRLVAFYAVAQASQFVPPGSVRIDSGEGVNAVEAPEPLPHVAFRTPQGKHVLLLSNPSATAQTFAVSAGAKTVRTQLAAGAVLTMVW